MLMWRYGILAELEKAYNNLSLFSASTFAACKLFSNLST